MTPKPRKSIRLFPEERETLVRLYLEFRIPTDQFEKRPAELEVLTRKWRELTGRRDTSTELIHYMKTQRKQGKWVRFDGEHKIAPSLNFDLTEMEQKILLVVYEETVTSKGLGSDNLAIDAELAAEVAKEFAHLAKRIVPATALSAWLTAKRKRGKLPRVGNRRKKGDIGFGDIDEAIG